MYESEPDPLWAKCSTPFCKNRDLYDNLQPNGMSDPEGAEAPRFCKKCMHEMSEDAMDEMREDRRLHRFLRTMDERGMKLVDAHGDLFFIQDETGLSVAGRVAGTDVEEMAKRGYIIPFRHEHAARAFELTELGRKVAKQEAEREQRWAQRPGRPNAPRP